MREESAGGRERVAGGTVAPDTVRPAGDALAGKAALPGLGMKFGLMLENVTLVTLIYPSGWELMEDMPGHTLPSVSSEHKAMAAPGTLSTGSGDTVMVTVNGLPSQPSALTGTTV